MLNIKKDGEIFNLSTALKDQEKCKETIEKFCFT